MVTKRKQTLSAEEARHLHYKALVMDSQAPGPTRSYLFTDGMKAVLEEALDNRMTREQITQLITGMVVQEVQTSTQAKKQYLDLWRKAGVTAASVTCAGPGDINLAFDKAVKAIADTRAIVDALEDNMAIILNTHDVEQAHREAKHGLIIDFQDTIPFGSDLRRIELFYNLGLRVVQLTYNLRNLVGDGCLETHKSGLSYFGREVVQRLNELGMVVDVSHSSEQVGWDALEVSSAPIAITHSFSSNLCQHDRGKSDQLARAIADKGGYFGVLIVPGFLQNRGLVTTLDDFVDHLEHIVDVIGIDHVGIGSDLTGNIIQFPQETPEVTQRDMGQRDHFNWTGFRKEHRHTLEYEMMGYNNLGDWPNITVKLAERGFSEEELRKLLGLNFLRYFREAVG